MKQICLSFIFIFLLLVIKPCDLSSKAPFKSGEKLSFKFHYGIINGGEGMFQTLDTVINNKWLFHTKFSVNSTGIMDKIIRVRDVFESYYDSDSFFPEFSRLDMNEGKFKYFDEVSYFQNNNYLISKKNGRVNIPKNEYALDVISAIFNARLYNWNDYQVNDTVSVMLYFRNKLFPMHVVYKGKELVSVDVGKIPCIKLIPITAPGTLFKKDEEMAIWFSNDKNKIPVCVAMKLLVGSVKFSLTHYEGLKYPLVSQSK